jgi:hypothetical protein
MMHEHSLATVHRLARIANGLYELSVYDKGVGCVPMGRRCILAP